MSLEIMPFGKEHWQAAAEVLAASHRRNRRVEPRLSARYEETSAALDVLEKTLGGNASGAVALRDGRVAGFMVALLEVDAMERVAVVLPSGAAITAGEDAELYMKLYGAAADGWVSQGYFVHNAHTAAVDAELNQAFFALGFGQYSAYNWRDLTPVPGPEAEVVIRRVDATAFDDEELLREGLRRYNASSPILHAFVRPPADQVSRILEAERGLMGDPANAYFIAYESDKPVGLMIFTPPEADYILTPEGSVYLHIAFVAGEARAGGIGAALVNRGLAWAREHGYTLCTVGYFAPNLLGARFWQGKGFKPLGFTLERRLDERIAWAKGEFP